MTDGFHVDNALREEMREQGIEANATQCWQCGVTRRSLGQPELHNARKVQSDKERARKHAIARKKKPLLLKTMQNRLQDAERSVRSGISDPPGIVRAKAKRQELTDLLNDAINELNAGSGQGKMLARAAKEHLQKLPPVKSAVQEAVSSLTDKTIHAKRAEVEQTTQRTAEDADAPLLRLQS